MSTPTVHGSSDAIVGRAESAGALSAKKAAGPRSLPVTVAMTACYRT
jgi:hypothetical protein